MLDLLEALQRRRADPLGGGVRRAQLGVLGLDRAQLVEQGVVLVIADGRVVEDVVAVVVPRQLLPQLGRALLGRYRSHRGGGAGGEHRLEPPAAQALEAAVVGEVEVDRRNRDRDRWRPR